MKKKVFGRRDNNIIITDKIVRFIYTTELAALTSTGWRRIRHGAATDFHIRIIKRRNLIGRGFECGGGGSAF